MEWDGFGERVHTRRWDEELFNTDGERFCLTSPRRPRSPRRDLATYVSEDGLELRLPLDGNGARHLPPLVRQLLDIGKAAR